MVNTPEQIRSDILTLLLAFRMNEHLQTTLMMKQVRNCCERLLIHTYDEVMIESYTKIIKAIYAHKYAQVKLMLCLTEQNYFKVYMNV